MSKQSFPFRWRVLLFPFSIIYGLVIWVRNQLFDNGILVSESFNLPIIGVGNISVGGTGKTPHVEYLTELLSGEFRVATLSRGYKRKTRDFQIASTSSSFREVGDEPLQIKRRFPELCVAVDRDRVNGVRQLLKLSPPVETILMDDGYQHRHLKQGYSILLMDYLHPNDRDLLLPAGDLREPAANRDRANIILITRTPERTRPIEMREFVSRIRLCHGQHLFFTSMRFGELSPVFEGQETRTAEWFRERIGAILLLTGIAKPRTLRQYARGINTNLHEMSFADHHQYREKDLRRIASSYQALRKQFGEVLVLTTEKDAVRLCEMDVGPELQADMHAVRLHVHFLNDDKEEFNKLILSYVSSNKRSSVLYKDETA